jgi:monofunctional glycosyltransferase
MRPPERPRIPPSILPRDEALLPEPEPVFAPEPEPEPEPESFEPAPRRPLWRRIGRGVWRTTLWTLLALFLLSLVPPGYVLWLRWHAPSTSAFMMQSPTQPVQYHWVPAAQIPDTLRAAVIAAEDQKFYTHWGFDFMAIAEALEHNEKSKRKRGASTITQQTAKNLFLWPSRSWLRKGLEVTFTLLLEGLWPKERILEVYLNIAEFGPGIYGAEAAARAFFDRPASELTPAQSARLAAVLPNPRKWKAQAPGPYVQSRVDWILAQIGYGPKPAAESETEEPLSPEPIPDEPQLEPEEPAPAGDAAPTDTAPEAPPAEEVPPAPETETETAPEATPETTPTEPAPPPS